MSTLVCPKCQYENIVLTCGFCLQCGNDLSDHDTNDSTDATSPSVHADEPQPKDLAVRLQQALGTLGAPLEESQNGWTAQLTTTDERRQRIHIMETTSEDGAPLVSFLSICGPAEARNATALLECNARLKTCAFAIRKINGESMFVVTANYPVSALEPDEIARTINEIAIYADRVEAQVGAGADRY